MRVRKLGELMVKRGGSLDPSKFRSETFELLSIPAFDKGRPEVLVGSEIGSSKKTVEPRDVLLSKIVPHIRRCWVVPERKEKRQIASSEWIQFRGDDFVPEYLRLFLMSNGFHSQFMKTVKGVGGSLLRASPAQVAEIEIPFPDLQDQFRIALLLGKVEGLIGQRKQHLQQLDNLLNSVFLQMFGDPVQNEKGWNIEPCSKAVLDISSGTSYGGEDRPFESPEEIGVLKISAVTKGAFDPAEFKVVNRAQIKKSLRFVKCGDFLFSRANTVELVAACCVVPEDHDRLFLPDKIWVLTLDEDLIEPQFLNYLLKNERYRNVVRSLASGGHDSMLNISMKKFMTLGIPCPPRNHQRRFGALVEKVEFLRSRYQRSLADLESLYGVLSQRAFKGQLGLSCVPFPVQPAATASIEDHSTMPESVVQTPSSINLPDAGVALAVYENSEARRALIEEWLEAYCQQLGGTPFSVKSFMAVASDRLTEWLQTAAESEAVAAELKNRLAELHPNNEVRLDAGDYESIKKWIFEELRSGALTQEGSRDGSRIELKVVQL